VEWRDEGIVIGVRRHGEASVVLELMTQAHGRHLGLVRGGRSSRLQPILQAGNSVEVVWRARLDEHLGNYAVEGTNLRAAKLLDSPVALYGLSVLGSLSRLLAERDPHPGLYETLGIVIDTLHDAELAAPLVVRFELAILSELGFGLDLSACAATGAREDLAYVSPRTGRAVSAAAGEAWQDRLLTLPAFMTEGQGRLMPTPADLAAAFTLTGYFLSRNVYEPRGLAIPEVRAAFIAAVTRGVGGKERPAPSSAQEETP
jgi:DNA repair protein RecO (recombination protein O)